MCRLIYTIFENHFIASLLSLSQPSPKIFKKYRNIYILPHENYGNFHRFHKLINVDYLYFQMCVQAGKLFFYVNIGIHSLLSQKIIISPNLIFFTRAYIRKTIVLWLYVHIYCTDDEETSCLTICLQNGPNRPSIKKITVLERSPWSKMLPEFAKSTKKIDRRQFCRQTEALWLVKRVVDFLLTLSKTLPKLF